MTSQEHTERIRPYVMSLSAAVVQEIAILALAELRALGHSTEELTAAAVVAAYKEEKKQ